MRAFRSSLRQQYSFPPFEPWDNKIFPFFLRSALRILGLFYYAGFDVILIITKRNREIFKMLITLIVAFYACSLPILTLQLSFRA